MPIRYPGPAIATRQAESEGTWVENRTGQRRRCADEVPRGPVIPTSTTVHPVTASTSASMQHIANDVASCLTRMMPIPTALNELIRLTEQLEDTLPCGCPQ